MVLSDVRVLKISAVGEGGWKRRGGSGRGEGEKRRGGDEEEPRRGKAERMRGWGGGAVFLEMQVLEIPAGGRGFPLVLFN